MTVGIRPPGLDASPEIFSSEMLAVGGGWYPPEVYRGTKFRWAKNDALIYVATMSPHSYKLHITIEPGPGVGLKPFELSVFNEAGQLLAKPKVAGKQSVYVDLPPVAAPKVHTLRLAVDGGGQAAFNDARIMNFRVFNLDLERLNSDVLPGWVQLGRGWYPLESFQGTTFRWVSNDAALDVTASGARTLRFDVEPGPGVDSKPFVLKLVQRDGSALGEAKVASRQTVTFELPSVPAELALHVDGGGKSVAGDPRIMNFRIFEATDSA